MKNKKDLLDPFEDITLLIMCIMLTLGVGSCGIAKTKFVYTEAGAISTVIWVVSCLVIFFISYKLTKKLFN